MKPTEMPVSRPTASSIWTSFQSSGKRHLLLTGSRGSGKTTLLHALFPAGLPGLTTWAEPDSAVWLRENGTTDQRPIGLYDPSLPGRENKMAPQQEGFLQLGIPALHRLLEAGHPWVSIDEIGYLEHACEPYCHALGQLMDKTSLAAVVRKQPLPHLEELTGREDVFLVDLDRPYGRLGCVILASGEGRRFGDNKLLADFHGRPLMAGALNATEGLFARRVVVTRHREVAALCEERGVEVLLHDLPHRSDTIRLGVETMEGLDGCLFCPGDQPLLRRETVAALALSAVNAPGSIWRPAFQGQPGAPVLFPAWAFPELRALPAGEGGRQVLRSHPEQVNTLALDSGLDLLDVDTPQALSRLLSC